MKTNSAFTLIELSIVLVIIGLIVGGVLVGNDLIKAAQLRSIASDWDRFEAARHTFRLKYNCIPGDCNQASTFGLGSNGNGNKLIDHPSVNAEAWLYWQHLANAGFIEGSYTGAAGPTNVYDAVIGTNVPGSKRSGVGWSVYQRYPAVTTWNNIWGVAEAMTTHFMHAGKDVATSHAQDMTFEAAFTVAETYGLDTKLDDGIASDGVIRTTINDANIGITCTTGAAPGYSYNVSGGGLCNLVFLYQP